MTLLVTGGNGFVMSNLVRTWLERDTTRQVIVLDRAPLDPMAQRFFEPVAARVKWVEGDISDRQTWGDQLVDLGVTRIVHGATVTPHPYVTPGGTKRYPEQEDPERVMRVNLMGTVEVLKFARDLEGLERFIYVSSGSVYGDHGPESGEALPEDGYVDPHGLYAISKFASELTVRRYAQLFGLSAVSARLSSVFGPMDRETSARHVKCVPYRIATQAITRGTLKIYGLDGIGDWIHAVDVADALIRLLEAGRLRHPVYNIAYGTAETLRTLVGYAAERISFEIQEVPTIGEASVFCDPIRREGQWGAYDISRLRDELGWQPAPLRQRMHEYIAWVMNGQANGS